MLTVLNDDQGGPLGREVAVTREEDRRTITLVGRVVGMQAGLQASYACKCTHSRMPSLLIDTGKELVWVEDWTQCKFRHPGSTT